MPGINPLFEKLSSHIDEKVCKRNKAAENLPKNEALVNWMDKEIDLLQEVENYIFTLLNECERRVLIAKKQSFYKGIQSGKLESRTGRPHPEYML